MRATKSVLQTFRNDALVDLLRKCLTLTYNAIHYGEKKGINSRRGMKEFYRSLQGVELHSCYKVAVITSSRGSPLHRNRRYCWLGRKGWQVKRWRGTDRGSQSSESMPASWVAGMARQANRTSRPI